VRVSIHICTKNRAGELYGLLVSLLYQVHNEWDLILVDSSNPAVTEWKFIRDVLMRMKLDGHAVKVIRDDSSKGVGRARNLAIESDDLNAVAIRIDDDSVLNCDYVYQLVKTYEGLKHDNIKVGAVGGLVPLLGDAGFVKELAPEIFNKLTFTNDSYVMEDDGAFQYADWDGMRTAIPSHHLRSSFLYENQAIRDAGMHPEQYGSSGFREETYLSFALLMKGYKLFTNTRAIAWHEQAYFGGVRTADYAVQVKRCDDWFNKWVLENKNELELNL
jgi:glycosyltransferase involved in cell wall biosynthesis